MSNKIKLHLIVPGIGGPLADTEILKSNPILNQWFNVLSRSNASSNLNNTYGVIAELFNLKTNNNFPSAALTLFSDAEFDDNKHYMHADPVHMQADMDHAVLTSSQDLNISESESTSLCESLNQHFNQDDLEFTALENGQWVVSAKQVIDISTTPLLESIGRNINFILPSGKDSMRWKQLLTEAQMLMHAHDVNVNRENIGQKVINSLWFHGCGSLPEINENNINHVCSDQTLLKGTANYVRCDYAIIPDTVENYIERLLENGRGSTNVLHLAQLEHLVNYTDVNIWLDKLTELLNLWIYPLLKASSGYEIELTLYDCNKKQYQFSKYDSLKFWKSVFGKGKIEQYVDSY